MKRPALIDANVVLRHLLDDDPRQSPEATKLFEEAPDGTLVLSALTLAEVTWVLLSYFKAPRPKVVEALQRVIAQPSVTTDAVTRDAVTRFASTSLDFADCVLAAESAASGSDVVTFDTDFKKFTDIKAATPRAALHGN